MRYAMAGIFIGGALYLTVVLDPVAGLGLLSFVAGSLWVTR